MDRHLITHQDYAVEVVLDRAGRVKGIVFEMVPRMREVSHFHFDGGVIHFTDDLPFFRRRSLAKAIRREVSALTA